MPINIDECVPEIYIRAQELMMLRKAIPQKPLDFIRCLCPRSGFLYLGTMDILAHNFLLVNGGRRPGVGVGGAVLCAVGC